MMISELDYDIMNNEVVFFFSFFSFAVCFQIRADCIKMIHVAFFFLFIVLM